MQPAFELRPGRELDIDKDVHMPGCLSQALTSRDSKMAFRMTPGK